jgi:NAD(P)-dependent dehydrogenase (short-subunit alcohol dehydrogenase family)
VKIFADNLLRDQVALVTGGGTGIGLAIAREFGSLGAKLAISSRKQENMDTAKAELDELGFPVITKTCDIRQVDQVNDLVDAVLQEYGRIDILINNAGGQFPSPAELISPNGWAAVINNNLNGTWYVTQTVANKWMINNGGKICSIVANMWRGFPGMVHTGAARAGVVNMTKTLGVEWARYKINVNAVAPGTIQSSGMKQYPPDLVTTSRMAIPAMRMGTEEETAWAVTYLCSPAADFVTGETLAIDGGAANWGDIWPIPDHVGGNDEAAEALKKYRSEIRKD